MFGPVQRGAAVTLRPPEEGDAERFVEWFADVEVTRTLGRPFAMALEIERETLRNLGESKTDVFWVIEAEGRAIGASGIHGIDWLNAHATTGTMIGERALWGRGYGAESVRLRTEYAFLQLNLHKLQTEVFADNNRSRRALERSGYRETGIAREHIWREGRWHDLWRAELLRSDWERGRFGSLPVSA